MSIPVSTREYRSVRTWRGLPLVHVAMGGRGADGRFRVGRARGVIAVGGVAAGVVAVGGVAVGVLSVGAVGLGLLAIGAVAVGLLAVGVVALGTTTSGVVHSAVGSPDSGMVTGTPLL